jgi:hypothetical protein
MLFVLGALFGRLSSRPEEDAPLVVQEGVREPVAVGGPSHPSPSLAAAEPPVDPTEPLIKPVRPLTRARNPRPRKEESPPSSEADPDAERWAYLDRTLKESLAARGLRSLDDFEALAPDSTASKRWRAARSARDLAEARVAADVTKRDIEQLAVDLPLLRKLSERLKVRVDTLPADRVASVEPRYLDLRAAIHPGLNASARTRLALDLIDFEHDLR